VPVRTIEPGARDAWTELLELADVCARLAARGLRRVLVGTATSGVRQLAFYQRLGFRLTHIERDYFTTERGYPAGLSENGIPTRDMAWMDRVL